MSDIINKLSTLGQNLQGSEIRRLFAISMRPGVISFAGGLPDPESFPSQKFAEITNKLLSEQGEIYLQYGGSRGSQEGFSAATSLMQRRGIEAKSEELIMTSGSQQAINLVTQVLVDPGEVILTENPTFIGALGVFRNAGAKVVGVPMDEDGIIISEAIRILDELKKSGERVKYFYLIPNFQNPTGLTMLQERRKAILELAEKYDFLILEDDPYGELWFEGGLEDVQPIKTQDKNYRVMYTSSFSKVISPGIRLAWVATSPKLIERLDMAKQMADVCGNPLIQGVANELVASGFLAGHIDKLRGIYQARRDAMAAALEKNMPEGVSWTHPKGGFYFWVSLPENVSALDMLHTALENNVAYVIGSAFYPDGSGKNTFRISFCHETEEIIEEGIQRLGKAVTEMLNS